MGSVEDRDRRDALHREIAGRMQACSEDELRMIDRVLLQIEWERIAREDTKSVYVSLAEWRELPLEQARRLVPVNEIGKPEAVRFVSAYDSDHDCDDEDCQRCNHVEVGP